MKVDPGARLRRPRFFPGVRGLSVGAVLVVVILLFAGPRVADSDSSDRTVALTGFGSLPDSLTSREFASLSSELSEPGGYFDSDNLVSNEASYLHVLSILRQSGAGGGVFVGVGPDQAFSYIAVAEPKVAFILDIRRDNLLLHLLYKAAFHEADTRVEFLSLFFGRPAPDDPGNWADSSIASVAEWVDAHPPTPASRAESGRRLLDRLNSLAVELGDGDLATIRRFHQGYVDSGLDIRFESLGRPSRSEYPTYRQMIQERDDTGEPASYLASEPSFRSVRDLQRLNLVVPVVGDLAGESALAAIGRWTAERGAQVSLFYASNVEFYLAREGKLGALGRNLEALPRHENSLLVRSIFRGGRAAFANPARPGYISTQSVAPLDSVVHALTTLGVSSYPELVSYGLVRR